MDKGEGDDYLHKVDKGNEPSLFCYQLVRYRRFSTARGESGHETTYLRSWECQDNQKENGPLCIIDKETEASAEEQKVVPLLIASW